MPKRKTTKRIPVAWKRKKRKLKILFILVFSVILITGFFAIKGKWFAIGEIDAKKVIPSFYNESLEVSLGKNKLTLTPMAGNAVKVVQKDVRYIYEGAYKNTDVVQSVYPYKIKEELIFWDRGHPIEFKYKLGNLETFIVKKDEKGNIKFYDKEIYEKTGELSKIFTIPAPFVEDKVGERSFIDVESIVQGDMLIIRVNSEWLSGAVYPVILDPTIEINVLNVYSHPSQGEDWIVEFTTKGKADLKITPQDQATIDDDEFTGLYCDENRHEPIILSGDVIYYQNWECEGVGKVIHKTLKAGHHTLKFEFSGVEGYAENWAYNDPGDTFRVTEYYLTTGAFTGTTYDLTLDQDLADDYFILIRGSRDGDAASNPDNDYARVYEVPDGKGELGDSGASNVIALSRHVADFNWEGVVTVVECLGDYSASGFQLLDIVQTSISGSATSGTDTSGTAWSDINDVVLFGGFHGGGAEFEADSAQIDGNAVQTRLYPTSTNTINWTRESTEALLAVTLTTFVVEWGSEWIVQYVNVTGSNVGDGCDATGEYNAGTINSVARDNTWIWATGIATNDGIGDSFSGTLVTLGDGVNQNTNETVVSFCGEYASTKNADIYTMTHSGLAADYRFKADGDQSVLDLAVTVDTATDGYRFGWVTNGCAGSGSAHPRDRFWARYTADTTVTISRGYDGQVFPAWVQGIDFSGIAYPNISQVHYRWRADNNGETNADWKRAEDNLHSGQALSENVRLRFSIKNTGGTATDYQFGLQVAPSSGTACSSVASSSYETVPLSGSCGTAVACMNDSTYFVQGDSTTAQLTSEGTWVAGEMVDTASISDAITINQNYYTEVEFNFQMTDYASNGTNYCFRVTNNGALLDAYTKIAEITLEGSSVINRLKGGIRIKGGTRLSLEDSGKKL